MYECSSCSSTYAWPQSLQRHIKNKHNAKDDETVSYEKDITSPLSSDNIIPDKEHMDFDESGDDSTESESGDDSTESEDDSTESESGDDSTDSESGDEDISRKSSTTEDVWDDMILEVYNTEDYATKVSEYANDFQNAKDNAKRDMLEVHTSDLKFNYYKLLLTYHRMKASRMHKTIMTDMKKMQRHYSYRRALRTAIHRRNSMFRKLLENDIKDDDEQDDERTYFEEFSD